MGEEKEVVNVEVVLDNGSLIFWQVWRLHPLFSTFRGSVYTTGLLDAQKIPSWVKLGT